MPKAIDRLDTERLRKELAGIEVRESSDWGPQDFRHASEDLCLLMAEMYNRDSLDVKKLWERIGTGIAVACEKVSDGDLDRFINVCLEHVKCDIGKVASNETASAVMRRLIPKEESWRLAFVDYLKKHSYVAVVFGRAAWEAKKTKKKGGAA